MNERIQVEGLKRTKQSIGKITKRDLAVLENLRIRERQWELKLCIKFSRGYSRRKGTISNQRPCSIL